MPTGASLDVSPPEFFALGIAGRAYNTGRGPIINPTGSAFRTMMVNPAGSNRLVTIHRLRYFSSGANEFLELRTNPTTNLPTFALPAASQRTGKPFGLAQVFMDVGPALPGGGTVRSYRLPVQPQDQMVEFLVYPLRTLIPGSSVTVSSMNSSGGDVQLVMIFDWFELDFLP